MRIRLADEDRKRFVCPEWLEWDQRVDTREAEAVEEQGADPLRLLNELTGGNPSIRAIRLMVWLALRRSGVDIPFSECHFDLAFAVERAEGKAPSAKSGSRTPGRSAASTPPSRPKRSSG